MSSLRISRRAFFYSRKDLRSTKPCMHPFTRISCRGGCRSRSAEPELFLVCQEPLTTLQVPTVQIFLFFYTTLINATFPHLATSKSRNSTLSTPECVSSPPPTQGKHEDNKHNTTTKSVPTSTPKQWHQNHHTSIWPARPILLPPQQQQ